MTCRFLNIPNVVLSQNMEMKEYRENEIINSINSYQQRVSTQSTNFTRLFNDPKPFLTKYQLTVIFPFSFVDQNNNKSFDVFNELEMKYGFNGREKAHNSIQQLKIYPEYIHSYLAISKMNK